MGKYSITISSDTTSSYTPVVFFANINTMAIPARIQKTQTLDGGVCVVNFGQSEGDRIFNINVNLSKTDFDAIKSVLTNITDQYILCEQGAFTGAITEMSITSGVTTINFSCEEKVS